MSRRALIVLALLAALVRVGFEVTLAGQDGPAELLQSYLVGDERAYDAFARQVAAGTLQRERAFYQEPLYAWLLGQVYRAFPPGDDAHVETAVAEAPVHRAVIWTQHLLGVLVVLLTATLGARAVSPRTGLLAGLMAAVSGPLVFHESMLLKAALSLVVLLVALHVWLTLLERPGARRALGLGLLLGAGILLRGNLYLLLGAVLASLVLPLGTERRRPGLAALVLGGALLALSPATIHNLTRDPPDPVLSTYQSGTNAALGQPDVDDPERGVIYEPLRAGRGDALHEEDDAVALAEAAAGHRLTGAEVSRFWWSEVRRRVLQRPWVTLERTLLKLAHLPYGREVVDVKDWAFLAPDVPWLATWASDFWLIGPWAMVGFCLLPWRRRPGLLVVRSGIAVVAVTLALFYVMGRYRLTAAPCLWICAAGAIDAGLRAWVSSGFGRRALVLALALLPPLVCGAWVLPSDPRGDALARAEHQGLAAWLDVPPSHLHPPAGSMHTSLSNAATIARVLAERAPDADEAVRRRDEAIAWSREALASAPLFPSARATLVRTLALSTPFLPPLPDEAEDESFRWLLLMEGLRTGVPPEELALAVAADPTSVRAAARALRGRPSVPGGDASAGPLLADASVHVAQSRLYVLRHLPDALQPAARPELEELLALLDRALGYAPDEGLAHVARAAVLKQLGRLEESERAYREALRCGADEAVVHNNLGNVLRLLGRYDEAVKAFEEALRRMPGDPSIMHNLERARAERDAAPR
ncbi:MAG: tetratricopeptide repeat protein [Planctomycetes bacterium]|nr:tetratricopeptide repeat protein [Planctomycetota bacterium]